MIVVFGRLCFLLFNFANFALYCFFIGFYGKFIEISHALKTCTGLDYRIADYEIRENFMGLLF